MHSIARRFAAERGRRIGHVEQRFVRREGKPVGLDGQVGDRLDPATSGIEAKYVAVPDLGLAAMTFLGNDEAVRRVGEPDRAVRLHHDVVRRVEALALPAVDDDGAVVAADAGAEDGAEPVRAVQERAVAIPRVTVGELGIVEEHVHAIARGPAQHAIVRDVAPQHAVVLGDPHRAFAPDGAGAKALERRRAAHDRGEAIVEYLDLHPNRP